MLRQLQCSTGQSDIMTPQTRNSTTREPSTAGKKCEFCSQYFARTEHLVRHRRRHTREQPFHCKLCGQRFSRSDALSRHLRRYHPDVDMAHALDSPSRSRASIACDRCHSKKMKCSGDRPCIACTKCGATCDFTRSTHTPARPDRDQVLSSQLEINERVDHRETDTPTPLAGQYQPPGQTTLTSSQVIDLERPNTISDATRPLSPFPEPSPLNAVPEGFPVAAGHQWWNEILNPATVLPDNEILPDDMTFLDCLAFQNFDVQDLDFLSPAFPINNDSEEQPSSAMREQPNMYTSPGQQALDASLNYANRHRDETQTCDVPHETFWMHKNLHADCYDQDIINTFVSIFQSNICPTFPIFHELETGSPRRFQKELSLAMAAVGGLFCSIRGAFTVARSLFSDARRVLLTLVNGDKVISDFNEKVVVIKSLLCLELFGILSGDKRCYEIVEGFHFSMIETLHEYQFTSFQTTSEVEEATRARLLESVYHIECYRVLFIQRPPVFYPSPSISNADKTHEWALPRLSRKVVASDTDPTVPYRPTESRIASLSSLVLLSWHIIPRSFVVSGEQSIWSPGFIETALAQWHQSHPDDKNVASTSLYLLVNIAIHSNLCLIQKLAYSSLNSDIGHISSSRTFENLRDWTRREECEVTIWHAVTLLQRAAATFLEHDQAADIEPFESSGEQISEPPQLVYGVYFACLVIWCHVTVGGSNASHLTAWFGSGKAILRVLHVRIARVLLAILAKLSLERPK